MTWINNHLNYTFIIGIITSSIFYLIAIANSDNKSFWFWLSLVVIMNLSIEIWYLLKKGRNLFYLFYNSFGIIGLIAILCLKNKSNKYI